jgi:hypothetical protein
MSIGDSSTLYDNCSELTKDNRRSVKITLTLIWARAFF